MYNSDTCNASWQKSRDGLIISSFVVSLITVGSITVIVIGKYVSTSACVYSETLPINNGDSQSLHSGHLVTFAYG